MSATGISAAVPSGHRRAFRPQRLRHTTTAMFLHQTPALLIGPALAYEPELPVAAPGVTFRRLRIAGLTAAQAGNLTARLSGLSPVRTGWNVVEIERLLFLRSLVDTGRVRS